MSQVVSLLETHLIWSGNTQSEAGCVLDSGQTARSQRPPKSSSEDLGGFLFLSKEKRSLFPQKTFIRVSSCLSSPKLNFNVQIF